MTSTHRAGARFFMNLPDGWMPLDVTSGRIPEQVERLLSERAAADPQVAKHRGQVEQQLRAAIKQARSQDLVFGALLATFTKNDLPIAASLALTQHKTLDGVDAHRILDELGEQQDKQNTIITLPYVGAVARSEYLDRTPVEVPAARGSHAPAGTATADVAVFQYYLPVPGGREVLIATGATPTLPMRAVFGTLFDAILSTFQFVDEAK